VIRNLIFTGAIPAPHRVESATDDILLTIIFSEAGHEKSVWERNFSMQDKKMA
jgi:hypothetical protein